ncbi:MAG: EAL domain-containing protein [Leptolyngbya sp. RL_3_1]|nr:EAL domain-containing protein [Leptolyngbya sp. RL_3_1]
MQRLIRQRFRKRIKAQELTFLFAANGLEALQVIKKEADIDVIITDINMPEMDGLSLLRNIAETEAEYKTIVVSAFGDIPNIRAAMNQGAFDFLTKPIDFYDLDTTIQKALGLIRKIQSRKQELEQLKDQLFYQAYHDPLTDLYNRSWFFERVSTLLERPQSELYGVLFIDLDRFKLINDSLGHLSGDKLLKLVSARMREQLQNTGKIARFGGDEFIILLENVPSKKVVCEFADRLKQILDIPFYIEDYEVFIGASIGIIIGSKEYTKPEELLRDADIAMYSAKSQGRGGYQVFDPAMQVSAVETLQLQNDLRRALESDDLYLLYQPIVSLLTGHVDGFEVLTRWRHPQRGAISPITFIPIAEEAGLIIPLGLWVLNAVCDRLSQAQIRADVWRGITINVNVSALQLCQSDLAEKMARVLNKFEISATQIKLEITESCLLDQYDVQMSTLRSLKNLGFKICIDDFGTGYSSLSRLHEFPIDTLKIDRYFIREMTSGSQFRVETVRMIITLAHTLGMDVVAEGVETAEQLQQLQALSCDAIQGYLFSKPVSHEIADSILRNRNTLF